MHRTVVEDEHTYAVRIDDGALLDGPEQIEHARAHLTDQTASTSSPAILGCEPDKLDRELDTLAARAKSKALKLRITGEIRDRARNGRYAFVHDRGPDFAAGIWVIDPVFMLDLVHEQLGEDTDGAPAARTGLLRRRAASTTTSCATRPPRTRSAERPSASARPRRPQQPRARPRHRAPG